MKKLILFLMLFCCLGVGAWGQSCVITGATSVCVGSTTTMSSACSGGTWSCSGTSATISTVGVVTGVTTGTVTINYLVGTSTYTSTLTVLDLPTPGTITGGHAVCLGSTLGLTATPSGGTWSSGSTSVATVLGTSGTVHSAASGMTIISYTLTNSCGSTSDTQAVNVETTPATPSVTSGSIGVCNAGVTTDFHTYFSPVGGTWSTSALGTIGTFSAGFFTSDVSNGTVTITYSFANSCGTNYATKNITVGHDAVPITGTRIMCPGTTGSCFDATPGGTWSTSASSIVSIDPSTAITTAVATSGTAIISYAVAAYGGCSASSDTFEVTVNSPTPITGPTTVCQGHRITLHETVNGGTWSSSDGTVATVAMSTSAPPSGVVGGVAPISCTVSYTCGTAVVTYTVTVLAAPAAPIVTGIPASLCSTFYPVATLTGSPSGGTWGCTPVANATINPTTGDLTGLVTTTISGGPTSCLFYQITYTVSSGGCSTQTFMGSNLVCPMVDAGSISGPTTLCPGGTISLTSSGDPYGTWSSSNTAVATVSSSGVVTYAGAGTTTISYSLTGSCNTSVATYTITAYPAPTAGTLSGLSAVCVGSSVTLTSSGSGSGTWSISDPTVATVTSSGSLTASVTGIAAGGATIIYFISNPCGSSSASATITVNPTPVVTGTTSVCVGSTTPVFPVPGAISASLTGGSWTISPTTVATISGTTGVVTGVLAGTAYITYTMPTGCLGVAAITVNPLPTLAVTNPFPLVYCGTSISLTATGAASYVWYGSGILSTGYAAATVPITGAITYTGGISIYTVTGTTLLGCTSTITTTLVEPPPCASDFCTTMGTGTIYGLSGTFGPVTFPAGRYYVYGDINFTGAANFSNAVISINTGKNIFVDGRAKLDINASHLFCSCPANLWQGITLNTVTTGTPSTGTVNIHGNSLEEDAVKGIMVQGGIIPTSGNIITSDGTVFNRNNIGISIESFPSTIVTTFPSTYPFLVRNSVFTSRDLKRYNDGTGVYWPHNWPPTAGTSLALKYAWTPTTPMMPPYNIISPFGAGAISGAYGGAYGFLTCKDGTVANIGVQMRYTGAAATTPGNTPATFAGVVVGDNSAYAGDNTGLNLFDKLIEGVYAYNSNFTCYNNAFMYMYIPSPAFFPPALNGDGIGAYGDVNPTTSTGNYNKFSMTVDGSATAPVTNNQFYDCYRCVRGWGYYYMNGTNSEMYSVNSAVTHVYYGYYMSSPRYYQVSLTQNTVSNIPTGIYMETANYPGGGAVKQFAGKLDISNNTIQSNLGGATPSATQFVNTGIDVRDQYSGVSSTFYSAVPTAHVDNNRMDFVYNGISVIGYHNQSVTSDDNHIHINRPAVMAGPNYKIGIRHWDCMNNFIRRNYILGQGSANPTPSFSSYFSNPGMIGIYGYLNVNADVSCNYTSSLHTGFLFNGAGNITHWYNNVMLDHSFGLVLNGTFGNQYGAGGPPSSAFNDWKLSTTSLWTGAGGAGTQYNTYTFAAPFDILNVDNNFGVYTFNPGNNGGALATASSWFGMGVSCTSFVPTYGMVLTGGAGTPTLPECVEVQGSSSYVALRPIATNRIFMGESGKPLNWIAQNNLYRVMLTDNSLAESSQTLAEFQSMAAGSRFAWLADIENAIAAGDQSRAQELLSVPIDAYVDTTVDSLSGVMIQDDVAADYIVNNYIDIANAYLNYSNNTMTTDDRQKVAYIANLCPFLNGNVVFQARMLYAKIFNDDTTVFVDSCTQDTPPNGSRRAIEGKTETVNQHYQLLPNPNSGSFMIQQSIADNKAVQVEVKDILGKLVYRHSIGFSGNKATIDLGSVTSGMYLVQIATENGNISKFKIVVQ